MEEKHKTSHPLIPDSIVFPCIQPLLMHLVQVQAAVPTCPAVMAFVINQFLKPTKSTFPRLMENAEVKVLAVQRSALDPIYF